MDPAVTISVRVTPRASRSEVVALADGVLKVRIAAPPVDGAANDELIRVMSKAFGVSRSSIEIVGGGSSRNKRVRLNSMDQNAVDKVLKGFS